MSSLECDEEFKAAQQSSKEDKKRKLHDIVRPPHRKRSRKPSFSHRNRTSATDFHAPAVKMVTNIRQKSPISRQKAKKQIGWLALDNRSVTGNTSHSLNAGSSDCRKQFRENWYSDTHIRPNKAITKQNTAGWSSPVAREAHNLEVAGSNPVPAT